MTKLIPSISFPAKFILEHIHLMLLNAFAVLLAIKAKSEIGTRQLLRDLQSHQPDGYGKSLLIKTLPLLSLDEKEWLRNLY